jgi:glycyl-tRNA synthetase beta chain
MRKDFLMEIGCEEIPAKMLPQAIRDIKTSLENALKNAELSFRNLHVYATPRRLALLIESLSEKQPDSKIQVVGPPREMAFLPDGTPGKAALGFTKGQNINLKKLKFIKKNGKDFLMAEKLVKGEKTVRLMPPLLQKIITELSFPKMMRWGRGNVRFVRPIRSLIVLFGSQRISMELFGVKSSFYTFGHRFLGRSRIKISLPEEYLPALKKNFVIADHGERKEKIKKLLNDQAKKSGCRVILDDPLMEEVTFLVEYPTAAVGEFSKRFLELPEEILITTLKHHQKCFSLKKGKKLVNKFLCVLNNKKEYARKIIAGNELIIDGRLSDAEFYWKRDRIVPFEERISTLKGLQFQEKLGSYYKKAHRLSSLSEFLGIEFQNGPEAVENAKKAALLCKADLTTEMVNDFPELQGIMGGIYSRLDGWNEEIAKGIYEHYLPYALTGESPESHLGSLLSISDKMDTIVGCFGLGFIPSGSRDPFALRRAAQGIIKVSVDRQLHLSLRKLIDFGIRLYEDSGTRLTELDTMGKIMDYFKERMKFFLSYKGYAYDSINAAVEADSDDPFDAFLRVESITKIRKDEDFEALAVSHKRIRNIIAQQPRASINEDLFQEDDEKKLYGAFLKIEQEVKDLIKDNQYFQALKRIATLRKFVDNFFDHVLVMAEETQLRNNRITLLASLSNLFMKIADFSEIVVAGEK